MTLDGYAASDSSDPSGILSESRARFYDGNVDVAAHALATGKLAVEALSCTIEDASVDTTTLDYQQFTEALHELQTSHDWITPKLANYLRAYVRIARRPDLPREETKRVIETGGKRIIVLEWKASSPARFSVSNAYAETVAIIERTLSDPACGPQLVGAFAERLDILRRELKVDHLAFIEKEAGPVGAITMLTSLVEATRMPACVYREKHWFERAAIGGTRPQSGARVAIVYDLIVTGSALVRAAERIRELTGATTVATVVLCGYGERRGELVAQHGDSIRIEALDWQEDAVHREPSGAASQVPRHAQGDTLPPGHYTSDTLPLASPGAQEIIDRVRARAQKRRDDKAAGVGLAKRAPATTASALDDAGHPPFRLKLADSNESPTRKIKLKR
jgi:orotate phosphoribosyltransferase